MNLPNLRFGAEVRSNIICVVYIDRVYCNTVSEFIALSAAAEAEKEKRAQAQAIRSSGWLALSATVHVAPIYTLRI